jgi:hypothetical protein
MTAIPNQVRNYLNFEDDIFPMGHGYLLKYFDERDAKSLLLTSEACAHTVTEYIKEKKITSPEYHQTMKDGRPITKFKIGTNWFELPFHVRYLKIQSSTPSFASLRKKEIGVEKKRIIRLYANEPPRYLPYDDWFDPQSEWESHPEFRCECSVEEARRFKKAFDEDEPARIFYTEKERIRLEEVRIAREKEKAEAIKREQIARNTFAVSKPSVPAPWALKKSSSNSSSGSELWPTLRKK